MTAGLLFHMSNRAAIHRWQAAVGCYSMHMGKAASFASAAASL